jgi:signal peptidase I
MSKKEGIADLHDTPELNTNQTDNSAERPKKKSLFREYAESIVIAILLAMVIRTYFVQAFKIPSGSMEDTLLIGDHLLVNKFIYGTKIPFTDTMVIKLRDPQQGDVVVFEYPEDPSKDFIKRIIGLPGDVVEGKDKQIFVNGELYDIPQAVHKETTIIPKEQNPRDSFGPIVVPENCYFVLGDNRDRSYDSRFWKFVRRDQLKGLAFIKYWSIDGTWYKFKIRWKNIGRLID